MSEIDVIDLGMELVAVEFPENSAILLDVHYGERGDRGEQGPQGPRGPDPWDDQAQVLSASGPLTVDYTAGKHVRLTLTGNVALTVVNWPVAHTVARLTLETFSSGNFQIALPPGTRTSNGLPLLLTPEGNDEMILSTTDGGQTVNAFMVGQNLVAAPAP